MNKIKSILRTQFNIDCIDISEIHGGLSTMNYKINTEGKNFFLKVYNIKKAQASIWIENINNHISTLVWLNENTNLRGRISRPLKTIKSNFRFDDDDNIYLLFDYIYGECVGKNLTCNQIMEAADIMACLHCQSNDIPINVKNIKEDFSVPFCFSLKHFITENYLKTSADIKMILEPYLNKLILKNNELKLLSEKVKHKNIDMVLCHTDAHGFNLMQSDRLILIDWEGLKLAPAEVDFVMFTKKEYWEIFIKYYKKLRPKFILDNEMLKFYILRRKIEDIWAFIESIVSDDLTDEQRKRDLNYLSECCCSLDNLYFEL